MERLTIRTSVELLRVDIGDILFVGADGNYSDIYLTNGLVHKMTFKLHYFDENFQQLKDNPFVRVGKSLIVNTDYIFLVNLSDQQIVLAGHGLTEECCRRFQNANRKQHVGEMQHVEPYIKLKVSKDAIKELKTLLEQEGGNV